MRRKRRRRRFIVRHARIEYVKREETCRSCRRTVLATIEAGLCGRCAVWDEYMRRAETGTLSDADRRSRPPRILFAR